MSDNSTYKPLNLNDSLAKLNDLNQIQQIKSVGSQPRPASTSPNAINNTNARALSTPRHVTNVRASLSRTSDVSSKVSVTFQRDPTDYYFSNAQVYVSGYKGNPAPVLVGSGQSPVSFSLENTGEPVSVTVQAVGNLGPAPLSTAPNATLKLDKTPLVTVATTAGNGTSGGSSATFQTNEVNNSSQSLLDLHAGTGIALSESAGRVNIDTTAGLTHYINPIDGTPTSVSGNYGQGIGWNAIGTVLTTTVVDATATECAYKKTTSSSTTLRWLQIWDQTIREITLGIFRRLKLKAHFFSATNVRCWVALTDYTSSTGDQFQLNDNPLSLCGVIGFRFSTFASDAHWKVCVGPSGGSLTVIDTGIAFDSSGAGHIFEIRQDTPGTLTFYIDGVLGATVNSNLPSTSARMQWNIAIDNDVAVTSAINLGFSWAFWEGTK